MSEVRLIDANALADVLQKRSDELMDEGKCIMSGTAMGAVCFVLSAPTITPESLGWRKEVVGRWEQSNEFDEDANVYSCSACGEPWVLIDGTPKENNMSYCPNCGARMDGEP